MTLGSELALAADQDRWSSQPGSKAEERLRSMVTEYHAPLWRFLARLGVPEGDVDDAVQEVILITARRLSDVGHESERSFLFSTAWRVATAMRRRGFRQHEVMQDMSELGDGDMDPETLADQKQLRDILDRILMRMPQEMRVVFVMYEIEGLTTSEISEALDISAGTVASRLRRAREDFQARVSRLQTQQLGGER